MKKIWKNIADHFLIEFKMRSTNFYSRVHKGLFLRYKEMMSYFKNKNKLSINSQRNRKITRLELDAKILRVSHRLLNGQSDLKKQLLCSKSRSGPTRTHHGWFQDGDPLSDHQITVCVRKRPMSQKENKKKEVDVVTCPNKDQVRVGSYFKGRVYQI